jgi:hypothetical protein
MAGLLLGGLHEGEGHRLYRGTVPREDNLGGYCYLLGRKKDEKHRKVEVP